MGFITKTSSPALVAYLTQKGRELLLNGEEEDILIKYFSIGDSDANYFVVTPLDNGYVPDLTGDNLDCVFSLVNNVGIKHSIVRNNDSVVVVPPTLNTKEVKMKRVDNGEYTNDLNVVVHLDKIARYFLYHDYTNTLNATAKTFNPVIKSPVVKLFDEIALLDGQTALPTDDIEYTLNFDPIIYQAMVNPRIENYSDNTVNDIGGVNVYKSPLLMNLSSKLVSGTTYFGAGAGSVLMHSREIGYYYGYTGSPVTFRKANDVEGIYPFEFFVDLNGKVQSTGYTNYGMAARIQSKIYESGVMGDIICSSKFVIDETLYSTVSNEVKFANQYCKSFTDSSSMNDASVRSIMYYEVVNMVNFVKTSQYYTLSNGTYLSQPMTFTLNPKNRTDMKPANLKVTFSYNEANLYSGVTNLHEMPTEGTGSFIQYL